MNGVAIDGAGNIVMTTDAGIRVVATKTGTFYGQAMTAGDVYTIAGDGYGYSGDGGPALSAEMEPGAVAIDSAGNVVFTDGRNNRVRVVAEKSGTFYGVTMIAGDIYTVAGDGNAGKASDGGPALDATVDLPDGVTIDPAGNLVITEAIEGVIRVVAVSTGTFYGQSMTADDIYTVAGGGHTFVEGGPALQTELVIPGEVTTDKNGNLVFAETGGVLVVAVSDGNFYGRSMSAGDLYSIAGNFGDTDPGVTIDGAGNVLIAGNNGVWLLAANDGTFYGVNVTAGQLSEIAGGGTSGLGDGGPGTKAEVNAGATAVEANGDLVILDGSNDRIRLLTH
jgi:hypothetical protein